MQPFNIFVIRSFLSLLQMGLDNSYNLRRASLPWTYPVSAYTFYLTTRVFAYSYSSAIRFLQLVFSFRLIDWCELSHLRRIPEGNVTQRHAESSHIMNASLLPLKCVKYTSVHSFITLFIYRLTFNHWNIRSLALWFIHAHICYTHMHACYRPTYTNTNT